MLSLPALKAKVVLGTRCFASCFGPHGLFLETRAQRRSSDRAMQFIFLSARYRCRGVTACQNARVREEPQRDLLRHRQWLLSGIGGLALSRPQSPASLEHRRHHGL